MPSDYLKIFFSTLRSQIRVFPFTQSYTAEKETDEARRYLAEKRKTPTKLVKIIPLGREQLRFKPGLHDSQIAEYIISTKSNCQFDMLRC